MQNPFHHLARGIVIKGNKVLLVQARGYQNTFLPGGHIEFGESAKDALIREFQEELGVTCSVGNFLGLIEHKWKQKGTLHCEINQVFEDLITIDHPQSSESYLTFFWCGADDLDTKNLQPYPFRSLIRSYLGGNKDVWWESTVNVKLDEPYQR